MDKGPGGPVFNHELRMEPVAELESVNYEVVNNWLTARNH